VKAALEKRKQVLVNRGHATDLGEGHIRAPKDLIQRLEAIDIERAGKAFAAERGRTWQPTVPGNYVTGTLAGSAQLSSGRFAVIESFSGDGGLGFSLVPWGPTPTAYRPPRLRHRHARRWGRLVVWTKAGAWTVSERKVLSACGEWAGPAPSRKGWRVPRPRFAACGLDQLSPARQELLKQVRLGGKRNASSS